MALFCEINRIKYLRLTDFHLVSLQRFSLLYTAIISNYKALISMYLKDFFGGKSEILVHPRKS